jgi:hypothetical protein
LAQEGQLRCADVFARHVGVPMYAYVHICTYMYAYVRRSAQEVVLARSQTVRLNCVVGEADSQRLAKRGCLTRAGRDHPITAHYPSARKNAKNSQVFQRAQKILKTFVTIMIKS